MSSRGLTLILSLTTFVGMTAVLSLRTFLVPMSEEFGVSVAFLAQSVTVAALIGGAVALVLGPLSDHYGHRRFMIIGTLFIAAGALLMIVAPSLWVLMLGKVLAGTGLVGAITLAFVSFRLPVEDRRPTIGWIASATGGSALLGIPVMALLGDLGGWRLAYAALCLVSVVLVAVLMRSLPVDPPIPSQQLRTREVVDSYRTILSHVPAVLLYLADTARNIGWQIVLVYLTVYWMTVHDFTLQGVALVALIGGGSYLVGTRVSVWAVERMGISRLCWMSTTAMGLTALGMMALPVSAIPAMALMIACGISGGIGYPALTMFIAEASPGKPAATMALRHAEITVSIALASAIGGVLLALGGFPAVAIGVLVISFGSVGLMFARERLDDSPAPVVPVPAPGK